MTRPKASHGFTIIELLIILVVIGMLTWLVLATRSDIQQKVRNSQRKNDLQLLQGQLEDFFSKNGYYPSRTDMNNSSWVSGHMKYLDRGWLIDPSNPTKSQRLAASPALKAYSYQVTQSDDSTSCESDDTGCAKYTLTATYEGTVNGEKTVVKKTLD